MDEQPFAPFPDAPATTPVSAALPSAGKMLRDAWDFYKTHSIQLLSVSVISFVISLPLLFADRVGSFSIFVFSLLLFFATLVVQNALIYVASEGGAPNQSVSALYGRSVKVILPMIWASILTFIAVAGGVMLFIIPGIIVIFYLTFVRFTVVLEGKRGMAALVESWHYAKNYASAIFWRLLVFGFCMWVLLAIAGAVGAGIFGSSPVPVHTLGRMQYSFGKNLGLNQLFTNALSYLFVAPFGTIYLYALYRTLRDIKGALVETSEEAHSIRRKLIGLSVVAVIGVIILAIFAGAVILFLIHAFAESSRASGSTAIENMSWADFLAQFFRAR